MISHKEIFAQALLIRSVEEKLLSLFSEGKIHGTVHTCIGQELTGVAISKSLQPDDFVFSNHRCHGHFIAKTNNVEGLIAEIMGKATGVCGGWGGSQHLCAKGFFSNGIQGGIVPVAAGIAMAEKLKNTGNIGVVFIGDGTLGEGVLYETMNLISLWKLPLLIVLENNCIAQSTEQNQNLAGNILDRARSFGIKIAESDTWNIDELISTCKESVAFVRDSCQPLFLKIDTFRLMSHSKGDDTRSSQEVKPFWETDLLAQYLETHSTEALLLKTDIDTRIHSAVGKSIAAQSAVAHLGDFFPTVLESVQWKKAIFNSNERIVDSINRAFKDVLFQDAASIFIGEDIESPYGGAFKATKDLSAQFPGRVRNTPISEAAIVGLSNGLALAGMKPVCEIMFGDFLALAADQILNHAAKFRYMYNDQVTVPCILRTPMGGRRGYGPTHSQSIEKHFLGIPDVNVIALNQWISPQHIYESLFRTIKNPTILIENKLLYAQKLGSNIPEGFSVEHTSSLFPTVRLTSYEIPDITIFCYGGMVSEVAEAVNKLFQNHDIIAEVIIPSILYPLDIQPCIQSIAQSGNLLIVEEGTSFAALSSEVIAQIVENAPGLLKKVKRCCGPEHPIPASGELEKMLLPNTHHIVGMVMEMLHGNS